LANGCRIFDRIDNPDEVLWNSMLIGYASNRYGLEAPVAEPPPISKENFLYIKVESCKFLAKYVCIIRIV
jgi:hypothetical protein